MNRPHPLTGVLAFAGWVALSIACSVVLLPANPLLRTVVWGTAAVLFAAAVGAPVRSLPLAGAVLAVSGVSSLAFGLVHPVVVAPVPLAAYLAGSALRAIYDIERPAPRHALTPLWRAVGAVSALSTLTAFVGARTAYLLVRDVPAPRVANRLGLDAEQAVAGAVAVLAALLLAAGFHALGVRAGREAHGARLLDGALVVVSVVAGGTAILQKLDLVPHLRAPHWEAWGRAQSTFTDPSAAGVAAALLLAPCLARAASGPWALRLGAGAGAAGLLVLLADAGSRGGFIGALVSALVLVLWGVTRAVAGQKPGVRRRVVLSAGTLSILVALAFGAALAWPSREGSRSALFSRISDTVGRKESTALGEPERLLLYEGALALAREHPVTGRGLGAFRTEFPNAAHDLLGRTVTFTDHPPSLYLGVLAETGLAGTAVFALFLAGLVPALGRALSFRAEGTEESLRAAGAASAVVGILVIFLFGAHLVYAEIAALVGLLAARLPAPPEGRSARVLDHFLPVVVAGASVLLVGGAMARGLETWRAEAAFEHAPTAGLWALEREPDGRSGGSPHRRDVRAALPSSPAREERPPRRRGGERGPLLERPEAWGRRPAARRMESHRAPGRRPRCPAACPLADLFAALPDRRPEARHRDRVSRPPAVTEFRFHSSDPRRRPRAWKLDARAGRVVAALLVLAGTLVSIGLFGAPDLVAYVVRSAERLAVRVTAERGLLAFDSVRLRFDRLEKRVAADELFLARVAAVLALGLPDGFPEEILLAEGATPTDLEVEVHRLGRRLRAMEAFRRRVASVGTLQVFRIPSRSPIEPASAVPISAFGPRISPLTHRPQFHAGLALAALAGTPVIAPAAGRVTFAGRVPGSAGAAWRTLGTVVVLAHDERTRTLFGYLGSVRVRRGQTVRRGDPLGGVGVNRFSPTPQLHYGVWKSDGRRWTPVDPRLHVLDADWITAREVRSPAVSPRDLELPAAFR